MRNVRETRTLRRMSTDKKNITQKFGGIRPMARAGKRHGYKWAVSTVSGWADNGIPRKRLPEVLKVAELEGVELTLQEAIAA